jgi:hypothetical protein
VNRTVKGMRAAADAILAATGPAGIDYLVRPVRIDAGVHCV